MSNTTSNEPAGTTPQAAKPAVMGGICPYCGGVSSSDTRCDKCNGPLDPLSRQATQNDMGPWFIRDEAQPFKPGCSYARVREMTLKGRIGPSTVLRGPSTRQFWMPARRVPGVANLLGVCHSCQQPARAEDSNCPHCQAEFRPPQDRQSLGIAPALYIPGRPAPEPTASDTAAGGSAGIGPVLVSAAPAALEAGPSAEAAEWAAAARRRGTLAAVLALALAGTIVVGVLGAADAMYDIGLGVRARLVGSEANVRGLDGTVPSGATVEGNGVFTLPTNPMRPSPAMVSSPAGAKAERRVDEGAGGKAESQVRPTPEEATPPAPQAGDGTTAGTVRKEAMEQTQPGPTPGKTDSAGWDARTFRGLR